MKNALCDMDEVNQELREATQELRKVDDENFYALIKVINDLKSRVRELEEEKNVTNAVVDIIGNHVYLKEDWTDKRCIYEKNIREIIKNINKEKEND